MNDNETEMKEIDIIMKKIEEAEDHLSKAHEIQFLKLMSAS